MVSQRYPIEADVGGMENNVYRPNDIRMSKNEKKK
jgi:hypothetical protein